jgi:hypothetical protein
MKISIHNEGVKRNLLKSASANRIMNSRSRHDVNTECRKFKKLHRMSGS